MCPRIVAVNDNCCAIPLRLWENDWYFKKHNFEKMSLTILSAFPHTTHWHALFKILQRCFSLCDWLFLWCLGAWINHLPAFLMIQFAVGIWASYQIRKIAGCACAGNVGNVFPTRRLQRKPLVNDPDMHHGTCVTHVPWCMSGSLTCGGGENVPGIPGACAPAILRIWQEAHGVRGPHRFRKFVRGHDRLGSN